MSLFAHPEFDHHEKVMFCHDAEIGLLGIIAVHSSALGPAAGGCRMYPYASTDDALTDVLRLSRGMSYKNAMAGLPLGGGKCVIIADPAQSNKAELLRSFSRHVQALGGQFWTAIDVGVSPAGAEILAENCDFIFARARQYPDGFDPSLFTAFGGFLAIRAAASHVWNREDLKGIRAAIQGLGATGRELARRLHEAGADLVVADIRDEAVEFAVTTFAARAVDPSEIHAQDVDIFAPCAMGGVINDTTLPQLKARAICGIANNQLAAPDHGEQLFARGITYVPDYLANGGGVAACATRIYSTPSLEESWRSCGAVYETVLRVLETAQQQGRAPSVVADEMARARIAAARPRSAPRRSPPAAA